MIFFSLFSALLLSTYTKSFLLFKNVLIREKVKETLQIYLVYI